MDSPHADIGEKHVECVLSLVGEKRSRAVSETSGEYKDGVGEAFPGAPNTTLKSRTESCAVEVAEVGAEETAVVVVPGAEAPMQLSPESDKDAVEVVEVSDLTSPEVSCNEVHAETETEMMLPHEEGILKGELSCATEAQTMTGHLTAAAAATAPEHEEGEESKGKQGSVDAQWRDHKTEKGGDDDGEHEWGATRTASINENGGEAPQIATAPLAAFDHAKMPADDATITPLTEAKAPLSPLANSCGNSGASQTASRTASQTAEFDKNDERDDDNDDEGATAAATAAPTFGAFEFIRRASTTTREAETNVSGASEAGTPSPPPPLTADTEDEMAALSTTHPRFTSAYKDDCVVRGAEEHMLV
ncbi:hypothetical protein ABB37_00018 [Leptomonas pyrrhocoris]|uniref:Uncharacterized protein n=1 Tax=Leptomonas pyrrhocoris TaxID=157538 RepID=A0A0N0DZR7_LEPPY|nr:hypothetical protein ABB37_00018 [Leptomonas pyrrhocoris]KPA85611.1 hypothetical protein ABB37_00018 [Leptomonas pyrrhocoris]|eukprot:XP_015664050.1 hypothetical protein ABB37_00018 [Leptomonas pyrrhocoris]